MEGWFFQVASISLKRALTIILTLIFTSCSSPRGYSIHTVLICCPWSFLSGKVDLTGDPIQDIANNALEELNIKF